MVDIPDDIPEAKRSSSTSSGLNPSAKPKKSSSLISSMWWVALAVVALISGSFSAWYLQKMQLVSVAAPEPLKARAFLEEAFATSSIPAFSSGSSLLGHRKYDEAPAETLVSIVADGSIRLRESAARSFIEMAAAARADGVILTPVSGFRSIEEQQYLFFGIKRQTGLRADERAEVSAPPGYSEHHTGYALDLIDGNQPDVGLEEEFEETEAFEWLEENASFYDFELSFEEGESGAVSYEPWQWRFVGDTHSLETFYGNAYPDASEDEPSEVIPSGSPRASRE
ncbi:MAG: M15 family metallopeptidase [Leptolyngbyaceae bacterium]|nr:M15 family metallopeptidase [Leptolyngbyaceae bacterium]